MIHTFMDIIQAESSCVSALASIFLRNYSSVHAPEGMLREAFIIRTGGDHYWGKLSPEGKKKQGTILQNINRFCEWIKVLSHDLPEKSERDILDNLKEIKRAIQLEGPTWYKTVDEASEKIEELFQKTMDMLESYTDRSTNEILAIVDTNALIRSPDIENWEFSGIADFTIVLTPTVLSELDGHKLNHKNPEVREKASSIIRRLKEYRRRGSLQTGVAIVKDKITLRAIATEPNLSNSLSWLDPGNADDRFLASSMEIMRRNLGAKVFIVTGDINLQNKAEMAGVPFCEVPEA